MSTHQATLPAYLGAPAADPYADVVPLTSARRVRANAVGLLIGLGALAAGLLLLTSPFHASLGSL